MPLTHLFYHLIGFQMLKTESRQMLQGGKTSSRYLTLPGTKFCEQKQMLSFEILSSSKIY